MTQRNMKPVTSTHVDGRAALFIGGARNVHGTRISKRVKCHKCGEMDYIAARPKGQPACCRSCAKQMFNAHDVGVRIPMPLLKKYCFVCRAPFNLPITAILRDKKPLCQDCMKGFDVWRGSLDMSPDSREHMTCEKRRSGTLLRKNIARKLG